MKVLLEFKGSHHYWENWKRDRKTFCPHCGKKEMWENQESVENAEYCCIGCGYFVCLDYGSVRKDEWAQIPRQLKSGIANKPTTKEGN